MSIFGAIGGGSAFGLVAEVGLGVATGGSSLAVSMATQSIVKAAAGEALGVIGQQLGLSQTEIDGALAATGFSSGGLGASATASQIGGELGFSPFEQGAIGRTAQSTTNAFVQMMEQGLQDSGERSSGSGGAHGGKGMSLLQAIAYAMGKAMDDKLNDMSQKANALGDSESGSSQYGQLSSEIQADSQELGMLSSAVSNAIKSIGEAGQTLAKKD